MPTRGTCPIPLLSPRPSSTPGPEEESELERFKNLPRVPQVYEGTVSHVLCAGLVTGRHSSCFPNIHISSFLADPRASADS